MRFGTIWLASFVMYWAIGYKKTRSDAARLNGVLWPYPTDEMTCWPVSQRVGTIRNNDPSLIDPVVATE